MVPSRCMDARQLPFVSRHRAAPGWPRAVFVPLLLLVLLGAIGWSVARSLDSGLLGFIFADLLFLIGVSFRTAVDSGSRRRTPRGD